MSNIEDRDLKKSANTSNAAFFDYHYCPYCGSEDLYIDDFIENGYVSSSYSVNGKDNWKCDDCLSNWWTPYVKIYTPIRIADKVIGIQIGNSNSVEYVRTSISDLRPEVLCKVEIDNKPVVGSCRLFPHLPYNKKNPLPLLRLTKIIYDE